MKLLRAFSGEKHELDSVQKQFNTAAQHQISDQKQTAHFEIIESILERLEKAFVLFYGGHLAITGTITPGQLSSMIIYSRDLGSNIEWLKGIIDKYSNALAAADRVFETMDVPVKIVSPPGNEAAKPDLKGDIHLEQVTFSYPTKPDVEVLKKLSLRIKAGETVGVVGSSGSGKSSLIALLERFYDPLSGVVKIDGIRLQDFDLDFLRQKIGYVQQEPVLFSGTIERNIAMGKEKYTQEELDRVIQLANAGFVYDKGMFPDGLKTEVGEKGGKLSGGQKQRIAIARALLKDPKIMIFDEATSALDAESENLVQKAVDDIMKQGDKTMIIIAHRLSTVKDCNKILVFEKGECVEEGSHDQLIEKDGVYKRLMDRQLAGIFDKKEEKEKIDPRLLRRAKSEDVFQM